MEKEKKRVTVTSFCFCLIAESEKDIEKKLEERTVHPDCINASNPYHECSEYCFRKIAEAKEKFEEDESGLSFDSVFSEISWSI